MILSPLPGLEKQTAGMLLCPTALAVGHNLSALRAYGIPSLCPAAVAVGHNLSALRA